MLITHSQSLFSLLTKDFWSKLAWNELKKQSIETLAHSLMSYADLLIIETLTHSLMSYADLLITKKSRSQVY